MSTLKVNAITDTSGGNTTTINSMTPTADSLQGFRNRIINGDIRIDQRNAGAAVTGLTGGQYVVDRWTAFQNYGTVTTQQSTTAPTGFVNSLYTTVTSTASVSTNSIYSLVQSIEGTNIADLGFGTASAKTITISFQVRSSVTGTYGIFIRNSAADRFYTSTFSISSANTWESKSITLTGDTGGTWLTSTGIGLTFGVVLGAGATRQGTANTWTASSSGPYTTSAQVDWMSNANATFYITGVQVEVGSVATPFERRPYGTELSLCQRYYWQLSSSGKGGYTNGIIYQGWADTTTNSIGILQLPVTMRTSPTLSTSGTIGDYVFRAPQTQGTSPACATVPTLETDGNNYVRINATTSNTFTVGAGHYFSFSGNTAGYIGLSAEL